MAQLSSAQAYQAMYHLLSRYWEEVGKPEDIGNLLSAMSLDRDGKSADPGIFALREEAIDAALNGRVDITLRFVSAPDNK